MTDYKATLNLPKTAFPMKANLAQKEPQILKKWQSEDIYQKIRNKTKGAKTFILHDGPPYANGDIHLGHAVNKILKDIIIKSKTLSGFNAPYIPGWDCHGLPIEHNVEKKIGKAGDKVDPAIFRKECRKYAQKQVNGQRKDFIRLGVFGDWDKPYLTMDYAFEADIVRALGKIAKNGHLVKGYKPVYWSVVGRSALAEAEVEYHDKTSFAIDVKFACAQPVELATAFSVDVDIVEQSHMVIWTTTPWTLPANQAISLHAQLNYQLLQFVLDGEQLSIIVAEDLAASVLARVGISEYEVLANCSGQQLEGVQFKHPFYARTVPVILGDHVTTEAGTGAVHTAPDHGVDDFNVGRKYGIGTLNIVADNGVYRDQVELFAGEHVYKVDAHILEVLQQHKALLFQEKITHSYPHCWRTKTPLIFRATPQWFISMNSNGLLEKSLAAVKQTQWIPDWGQARIESMLNSSPDWCVSRQRTWGVPITLFIHSETEELHPNTEALTEQVAQLIADKGMDAWFDLDSTELLGEDASDYQKVTDTLDVWFDSGVTHQAVLETRKELSYPADLYLEGSDQHRGWFQSSLKSGLAITGQPPYKAVLTHGFTVDSQGKKMSKSLGNVISPQDVMKTLGADIIRLWIASTDYRGEMTVSDEILKRASDSYRRIRNTARFLLSNLNGFDPQSHLLATKNLLPLDQWAVDKAWLLQQEIQEAYESYQFHAVYQKVHNFCAVDLGAFYLDIIKDRQYTTAEDSLARRSCQTAMYHIGQALVRWIAPILSFTAEELWQFMPGNNDDSVFLLTWYDQLQPLLEQHELPRDFWLQLMEVKTAVNKALEVKRKNKEIGSSLSAEVILYCSDELQTLLMGLGEELRFALITSAATIKPLGDEGEATELDGLRLHVEASKQTKCVRCWHYDDSVGQHGEHEELCARCVDNVVGPGEQRFYV